MCGFCNVCFFFDNCEGVLVICALVFTVVFIVSFMYIYSYLFFCASVMSTVTQ